MSSVKVDTLREKISTLKKQKTAWKKGTARYTTNMGAVFTLCRGTSAGGNQQSHSNPTPVHQPIPVKPLSPRPSTTHIPVSAKLKECNTLDYELSKKQKQLDQVHEKIITEKENLQAIVGKKGHYSVRNTNKRDNRARKSYDDLKEIKKSNTALMDELSELKQVQDHEQITSTAEKDRLRSKIKAEQKLKSKARISLEAEILDRPSEIEALKSKIEEQALYIRYLENEVERLKSENERDVVVSLRDKHGYTIIRCKNVHK